MLIFKFVYKGGNAMSVLENYQGMNSTKYNYLL